MTLAPIGTPIATLGTIHGTSATLACVNNPLDRYAIAVIEDSASRTNPSAARNSRFANPWLLSQIASGGPEIVVTEYNKPTPAPNGSAADRSDRMGLRNPAAWNRINGNNSTYV